MLNLGRRAARALAAGIVIVTVGLPLAARAGNAPAAAPTTPRTKFVLPGGEVVIGQIISFEGEMYVIKLPRGVVMLRKDFPIAVKTLNAPSHDARQSPRIKPIL